MKRTGQSGKHSLETRPQRHHPNDKAHNHEILNDVDDPKQAGRVPFTFVEVIMVVTRSKVFRAS